ncbi:hypothetical protein AK88_03399 [Plasmodium fragile]|uniref:RNB domain-containing protein n=1 Tax=Plasmodium fragile TaxID=5857 RepID=A0A0D9QIV7_PLAFR|nr:uncharacterized protein AK88_03399 [Plasmodium fragile]KJP87000.1 hypothetical protein AK88_03399 [Plasmodium fragile]
MNTNKNKTFHKKLKNKRVIKEFSYVSFKKEIAKLYEKEKDFFKQIHNGTLSSEEVVKCNRANDPHVGQGMNRDEGEHPVDSVGLMVKVRKGHTPPRLRRTSAPRQEATKGIDHKVGVTRRVYVMKAPSVCDKDTESFHSCSMEKHIEGDSAIGLVSRAGRNKSTMEKGKMVKREKLEYAEKETSTHSTVSDSTQIIRQEEKQVIKKLLQIIITKKKITNIVKTYFNENITFVTTKTMKYILKKAKKNVDFQMIRILLIQNVDKKNIETTINTKGKRKLFKNYIFSNQRLRAIECALLHIYHMDENNFTFRESYKELDISSDEYLLCVQAVCIYLTQNAQNDKANYRKYWDIHKHVKELLHGNSSVYESTSSISVHGTTGVDTQGDDDMQKISQKKKKKKKKKKSKNGTEVDKDIVGPVRTDQGGGASCMTGGDSSMDKSPTAKLPHQAGAPHAGSEELLKMVSEEMEKRDREIDTLKRSIEMIEKDVKLLLRKRDVRTDSVDDSLEASRTSNSSSCSAEKSPPQVKSPATSTAKSPAKTAATSTAAIPISEDDVTSFRHKAFVLMNLLNEHLTEKETKTGLTAKKQTEGKPLTLNYLNEEIDRLISIMTTGNKPRGNKPCGDVCSPSEGVPNLEEERNKLVSPQMKGVKGVKNVKGVKEVKGKATQGEHLPQQIPGEVSHVMRKVGAREAHRIMRITGKTAFAEMNFPKVSPTKVGSTKVGPTAIGPAKVGPTSELKKNDATKMERKVSPPSSYADRMKQRQKKSSVYAYDIGTTRWNNHSSVLEPKRERKKNSIVEYVNNFMSSAARDKLNREISSLESIKREDMVTSQNTSSDASAIVVNTYKRRNYFQEYMNYCNAAEENDGDGEQSDLLSVNKAPHVYSRGGRSTNQWKQENKEKREKEKKEDKEGMSDKRAKKEHLMNLNEKQTNPTLSMGKVNSGKTTTPNHSVEKRDTQVAEDSIGHQEEEKGKKKRKEQKASAHEVAPGIVMAQRRDEKEDTPKERKNKEGDKKQSEGDKDDKEESDDEEEDDDKKQPPQQLDELDKLSDHATESGDSVVYNYNLYNAIYDLNEQFSSVVKNMYLEKDAGGGTLGGPAENENVKAKGKKEKGKKGSKGQQEMGDSSEVGDIRESSDKKRREEKLKKKAKKKEEKRRRKELLLEEKRKVKETKKEEKKRIKQMKKEEKKKLKEAEKEKKKKLKEARELEEIKAKEAKKAKRIAAKAAAKKVQKKSAATTAAKRMEGNTSEYSSMREDNPSEDTQPEPPRNDDYNFIEATSSDKHRKMKTHGGRIIYEEYITQEKAIRGIIKKKYIRGILTVRRHDYGFVVCNDRKVHIKSKKDMNRAIDGDAVVVKLNRDTRGEASEGGKVKRGKRVNDKEQAQGGAKSSAWPEENKEDELTGKIIYIEEHHGSNIHYVCIFREKIKKQKFSTAIPFKKSIPFIKVENKHIIEFMKRSNVMDITNQLVYIKIFRWNTNELFPEGRIVELLGQNDLFHNMQNAILLNHNLYFNLKQPLEDDFLKKLKNKEILYSDIVKEEIMKRMDLSKKCIFTIDPETARDLDDAINISRISKKKIAKCNFYIKVIHNLMVHNGEIEESILEKNLSFFVKEDDDFFQTLKENNCIKEMEDIKYENFVKNKMDEQNKKKKKKKKKFKSNSSEEAIGNYHHVVGNQKGKSKYDPLRANKNYGDSESETGVLSTTRGTHTGVRKGDMRDRNNHLDKCGNPFEDSSMCNSGLGGENEERARGSARRKKPLLRKHSGHGQEDEDGEDGNYHSQSHGDNEGSTDPSKLAKYQHIFKKYLNEDIGRDVLTNHDLFCEKCKRQITLKEIIKDMTEKKWKKYNLFEVGVHITDVAYFIKENSSLDIDARNRAMTIYLTHTCFPMISRILSESLCSLDPVSSRLCLSIFFYMDSTGKIDHNSFFLKESIINSKVRFTYQEVYLLVKNYSKLRKVINRLMKEEGNRSGARFIGGVPAGGDMTPWGSVSSQWEKRQEGDDAVMGGTVGEALHYGEHVAQTAQTTHTAQVVQGQEKGPVAQAATEKEQGSQKSSLYRKFLNLHFYSKKKKSASIECENASCENPTNGRSEAAAAHHSSGISNSDANNTVVEKNGANKVPLNQSNGQDTKKKNTLMKQHILQHEEVKAGVKAIVKIFKNLNNRNYKLSYKKIFHIVKNLYYLYKISKRARVIRKNNGSLLFNNDKMNIILSSTCTPIAIVNKKYTFANYLVEELMLSANKLVAIRQYFSKYRNVSVFRCHSMDNIIETKDIIEVLEKHGIYLQVSDLRHILKFLDNATSVIKQKSKPISDIVCAYAKKKMMRAEYHTFQHIKDNKMSTYHYALSFLLYTHFTSPIRRYPDILVHRVIKKILSDENKLSSQLCTRQEILALPDTSDVGIIEDICEKCNNCKTRSKWAQIDCEIAFFCLYLQKHDYPGYNRGIIMDIYKEKASIFFKSFSFENSLYYVGYEKHISKMNKSHQAYLSNYVIYANTAQQELTLSVYSANKRKLVMRKVYKRFDYIPLYFFPLSTMPPSYFLAVAIDR